MIAAVEDDIDMLYHADDSMANNKEVMLAAVRNNGKALKYASDELSNNKEVVLAAVRNNVEALEYASDELSVDIEVVMQAIINKPAAIQFIGEDMLDSEYKQVVLVAVGHDGDVLEHVSEEIGKDPEVVARALSNKREALRFVDVETPNYKDFVISVVKEDPFLIANLSEEVKRDKDVLVPAFAGMINCMQELSAGCLGLTDDDDEPIKDPASYSLYDSIMLELFPPGEIMAIVDKFKKDYALDLALIKRIEFEYAMAFETNLVQYKQKKGGMDGDQSPTAFGGNFTFEYDGETIPSLTNLNDLRFYTKGLNKSNSIKIKDLLGHISYLYTGIDFSNEGDIIMTHTEARSAFDDLRADFKYVYGCANELFYVDCDEDDECDNEELPSLFAVYNRNGHSKVADDMKECGLARTFDGEPNYFAEALLDRAADFATRLTGSAPRKETPAEADDLNFSSGEEGEY